MEVCDILSALNPAIKVRNAELVCWHSPACRLCWQEYQTTYTV